MCLLGGLQSRFVKEKCGCCDASAGESKKSGKLPPVKTGGFMPSSRLELWQGLVYATHSSEDFAPEPSSPKYLIIGNLPIQFDVILVKKYLKVIPPLIADKWSPCGGCYEHFYTGDTEEVISLTK